jgi:hypothetical protein
MKKSLILLGIITIIGFQSCMLDKCYNKKSFLTHLEDTVDKSVEKSDEWTEEDWEKTDAELEKLMDECYEKFKKDLTRDERRKVLKESSRYIYHRQKEDFKDFFAVIEGMNLEEEAQRLVSMADEELKAIFNDVLKDDLETFIDDAVGEFENLAKELKEAWEEAKEDNR